MVSQKSMPDPGDDDSEILTLQVKFCLLLMAQD